MNELLVLVDENDRQVGAMDKLTVHRDGLLHRAFSVFIFNSSGQLLIQKRAAAKYHSASLWSNSCCSHPRDGEDLLFAVYRRLKEEIGLFCNLESKFSFIYKTEFENGLKEFEIDHVFFGISDDLPVADVMEVESWRYIGLAELQKEIRDEPGSYTYWLKCCLPQVIRFFNNEMVNREEKHLVA